MQRENKTVVPEIITIRLFNHPINQVFNAWADPQLLAQWWGPKGFSNTFHEFDFTAGGEWKFTMHAPDGTDYFNECRFVEIKSPDKIVLEHIEPIHTFTVTATFEELNKSTRLSFSMQFDLLSEYEKLHHFIAAANEENFDRLEYVLQHQK
ncbi:hypothetical protein CAP36_10645 [Chitinophagaceae bacterium IBVUCB2]|nr:hypothetical protein CAP36_10645 [Chitinophagaceae bacterium IBVUCB2]